MQPKTTAEQVTTPKGEYVFTTGKRKTSVASIRMYKGDGQITVNGKVLKEYFKSKYDLDTILSPLVLTDMRTKVDCTLKVVGGGQKSQADAVRHAISRGLLKKDPTLRPTLKKSGFLTRDSRIKERKKPGLKRARKAPQWSKR